MVLLPPTYFRAYTLVLLVHDSKYNNFTGTQPIPCRWCIYFVCPWRAALALLQQRQLLIFAAAAARALTPPRPPFGGRKVTKKTPVASALAVGHVCVGVGEVEAAFCFAGGFGVLIVS
jgi:hypothetical protein